MKKSLALVLAALFAVSLAACGKKEEAKPAAPAAEAPPAAAPAAAPADGAAPAAPAAAPADGAAPAAAPAPAAK